MTDDELAAFCRRWGLVEVRAFGSVLRADFDANSDIDLLVRFAPGTSWPWGGLADIQEELTQRLRRRVDVVTCATVEESENYIRRQQILSTAQPLYEE
jgi:predicted nucleotidyltransferase